MTGKVVLGQYLALSTWRGHWEAQQALDVEEQVEQLANTTFLCVIALTDTITGGITSETNPDNSSSTEIPSTSTHYAHEPSRINSNFEDQSRSFTNLQHLGTVLNQKVSAFIPPRYLQFASPPAPLVPYQSQFTITTPTNKGLYALKPRHEFNSALMRYEVSLVQVHDALDHVECHHDESLSLKKKELMDLVQQALRYGVLAQGFLIFDTQTNVV
ncbi:hypothetical protein K439DRAFT_1620455 [Ramaria rubella]|nr:hypothetical protein K439DRAFT_1620455 [Ramaria rubella]